MSQETRAQEPPSPRDSEGPETEQWPERERERERERETERESQRDRDREREREREREGDRERESQRDRDRERERERERGRETLGACDPSTLDPDPRPQTFAVLYHPAAPRSPSALSLSLSAPALGPRPAALRARLACESWVIRHGVMGHGPWVMGHGGMDWASQGALHCPMSHVPMYALWLS